ncbi:Phenylalanine-4-hydroxylase [gamma proteobacterium IMCC1989]|nr:Phenylalanine-4-hydroxylase [gamma proteobacterium IMCC1989]
MAGKQSNYIAKKADDDGIIHYSEEEHDRWRRLMSRQKKLFSSYAASAYLDAFDKIAMSEDHIPQCHEISKVLLESTGWCMVPVPALIDFSTFFTMLSNKQFPAASFIRSEEELDYLKEPDIFHEILGHAPLLIDPRYAAFVQAYGKAGCRANKKEQVWLARLFWFTVEFGLLRENDEVKAFGAGIVSSHKELPYSVTADDVDRRTFDEIDILRTPYRIDILQPVYFILDDLDQMTLLSKKNLLQLVNTASNMGLKPKPF